MNAAIEIFNVNILYGNGRHTNGSTVFLGSPQDASDNHDMFHEHSLCGLPSLTAYVAASP